MTRDEIVTALRCVAVCDWCDCSECESRHIGSGTCVLHKNEYFSAASYLIENQQRHIEALMKANDSLKDAIARRDKQIAVRCRECKQGEVNDPDFPDQYYCHAGCGWNNGDFYCAYGEREEGADNG